MLSNGVLYSDLFSKHEGATAVSVIFACKITHFRQGEIGTGPIITHVAVISARTACNYKHNIILERVNIVRVNIQIFVGDVV